MNKIYNRLAVLAIGIILLSCTQKPKQTNPENFDYGRIENGVYKNNYFGMEVPIPPTWVVQNKEQIEKMFKMAQDSASAVNKDYKLSMTPSQLTSGSLLVVYRDTVGSTTEFNPGISIGFENVGKSPGLVGKDVLIAAKNAMDKSNLGYQYDDDMPIIKIGGKDFYKMTVHTTSNGSPLTEEYIAGIQKGFALFFVMPYAGDEQKDDLYKIINGIKFND
jgi:hypothetical protein